MTESKLETGEVVELENIDQTQPADIHDGDLMDTYIEIAAKIDAFDKAQTAILNYILKKTYAGDWISHSKASEPVLMRNANITGAGAERIANAIGIQETNWKRGEKMWSDDKKHYTYECSAQFSLGRRTVTAYGRAGSSDKFFGFAGGQWKNIEDVKEDDIKMAAFRNCRKEGIRTLLGLRKIPISKLKELGFNIDYVHMINFKSAKAALIEGPDGESVPSSGAAATASGQSEKLPVNTVEITIREMKVRKYKDTPIIDVITDKGERYSWWGMSADKPEAQELANMMASGWLVQIEYTQKGEYLNLKRVVQGGPQ